MDMSWLTERPVAHRGYHDVSEGRPENTLPALQAAIDRGFAIEIDVQLTKDNEAVCFHDEGLKRLCGRDDLVSDLLLKDLRAQKVADTNATIPSLGDVLDCIKGQVPLFIEVKSRFLSDGEPRLTRAVSAAIGGRDEQIALMSFDPLVVSRLQRRSPTRPRGIISDGAKNDAHWGHLTALERVNLQTMMHWPISQPDFVAYSVDELPALPVTTARWFANTPILTWTVRTPEQVVRAHEHADQMIFEGFDPSTS